MAKVQPLGNFGITGYPAKALVFLLSKQKPVGAEDICKSTGIPVQRIYSVMKELEREGVVRRLPGKIHRFSSLPVDDIADVLRRKRIKQLKQMIGDVNAEAGALKSELKSVASAGKELGTTTIEYYDKDSQDSYMTEVSSAESKTIIRRILFTDRLGLGDLEEDLALSKGTRERFNTMLSRLEKGLKTRNVFNPRLAAINAMKDLMSKDKLIESMTLAISRYYKYRKLIENRVTYDINDLTVTITDGLVALKFRTPPIPREAELSSGVIIKDKNVARDFQKWFDGFFSKQMSADESFLLMKNEVLKQMEQLYGIRRSVMEEKLRNAGVKL